MQNSKSTRDKCEYIHEEEMINIKVSSECKCGIVCKIQKSKQRVNKSSVSMLRLASHTANLSCVCAALFSTVPASRSHFPPIPADYEHSELLAAFDSSVKKRTTEKRSEVLLPSSRVQIIDLFFLPGCP